MDDFRWPTRRIASARDESGFALVTVLLVVAVMTMLMAVMLSNTEAELNGVRRQRAVSNARDAADGGLDQIVYQLGVGTNWSGANEAFSKTTYASPVSGPLWASGYLGWTADGNGGRWRAHIDVDPDSGSQRIVTIQAEYPSGSGQYATIQATVRKDTPEAFDYAVFADKGVDIHHHNSSFITPTVVTPKVHSNGYVNIDWSASFHVDTLSAATKVTIAKGGGTLPGPLVAGGSTAIPTAGYVWSYYLPYAVGPLGTYPNGDPTNPARCFPSKVFPPLDWSATTWNFPATSTPYACAASPKFTGNAQVMGNIEANQVQVTVHGDTTKYSGTGTCSGTTQQGINDPITNACIATRAGDIDAGYVDLDVPNLVWTGPASGNVITTHFNSGTSPAPCTVGATCVADCTVCNQGTADTGGSVGGVVNIHPSAWGPGTIPFPNLDFRGKYFPVAKTDQGESGTGVTNCTGITAAVGTNDPANSTTSTGNGGETCHIFPTKTNNTSFLNYVSNPLNVTLPSGKVAAGATVGSVYDPATDCTKCVVWLDATKHYLRPTTANKVNVQFIIANGTYFMNAGTVFSPDWAAVKTAFGQNTASPTSPAPTIVIRGALVVEDGDSHPQTNLTIVGPTMDPFAISLPTASLPQGANTLPGLYAVGGKITVDDYDDDTAWDSTGLYERYKRNLTQVRGIVYSGSWDSTTQTNTAEDQHWHSYDVKNQELIIGAQIGGKLHDCNSFIFAYDPLVKNLGTFTSGVATPAYVSTWQQIPTTA